MHSDALFNSPTKEILAYLAQHPGARDTLEGIVHWWVLEACLQEWSARIPESVALLVERGFLVPENASDGRVFYQLSTKGAHFLKQSPS